MPLTPPPKALLFDVFGTCVDWRTSVARESEALGRRLGIALTPGLTCAKGSPA